MASLLEFTDRGIFCPQGDFYIDPWRPVQKALITHAHADHARPNHQKYLAHTLSKNVMLHRLGSINLETTEYGEKRTINGVQVSFHPAGHIPGSAQIRLEHKGKVAVVSGDYKIENDGISTEFESLKCHQYVSECTFGLPIYKWPQQKDVIAEINNWWRSNKDLGKNSVVFSYSLGKAQRIINNVDSSIGNIFTHGAVENMNEALREDGMFVAATERITRDTAKSDIQGALIVAPPSAVGTHWLRKLQPYSTGFASGWMMLRGTRRRKAADRGFILSDHADWNGLLENIEQTEAEEIYLTHGYTDALSRYLNEKGLNAQPLETLYEGESLEGDS